MRTTDEILPNGEDMTGGCMFGDATSMIDRTDAQESMKVYGTEIINEILSMYVEDGNPVIWKEKIINLKNKLI